MTFVGDRDGDGTGRDGQTDKRTNIWTDRLFSENIILDLGTIYAYFQIGITHLKIFKRVHLS